MKSLRVMAVGAALSLALAGGPALAQQWQNYSATDGRFTAAFPTPPKPETQTVDVRDQKATLTKWTAVGGGNEAYVVSWIDLDPSLIRSRGAAEVLTAAQRNFVERLGSAQVQREQSITLGGHPGRSFDVQASDGFVYQAQLYLVGNRLYQNVAMTDQGKAKGEGPKRFLDSFQVTSATTGR